MEALLSVLGLVLFVPLLLLSLLAFYGAWLGAIFLLGGVAHAASLVLPPYGSAQRTEGTGPAVGGLTAEGLRLLKARYLDHGWRLLSHEPGHQGLGGIATIQRGRTVTMVEVATVGGRVITLERKRHDVML